MSHSARRQLLFQVGEHLLAADAGQVSEVREPTDATPVPGSVPGILGLINLRGSLVIAGELSRLLGFNPLKNEETALVVFDDGERRVALEVDRLVGMVEESSENLDVEGELLEALGADDIVAGIGQFQSRPYFQLDIEALFARILDQDVDRDRAMQLGSIGGWER